MTGYNSNLNGFQLVLKSDFETSTFKKIENTFYIVKSTNGFDLYLGSIPLMLHLTQEEYDSLDTVYDAVYIIVEGGV